MAVLLSKDKKELIVSCSCGCEDSFHLTIDCDDDTDYAFLSYMNGDFYRNKNTSFFVIYVLSYGRSFVFYLTRITIILMYVCSKKNLNYLLKCLHSQER